MIQTDRNSQPTYEVSLFSSLLDFSPRATISRSTMAGQCKRGKITKATYNQFVRELRDLIAADLSWFVLALTLCPNLKSVIMAGSVTNDPRTFLDRFLQSHLPSGYSLTPRQPLLSRNYGDTALYDLVGPQLNFPVLFVSESPSGKSGSASGTKISNEVQQNLSLLKKLGF